jgi:pantetheine-phosphate adenylyltransferase
MRKAVFPGSFDPPTLGHLDLIGRSAAVFDELLVVVAENRRKSGLFSAEERYAMLEKLVKPWENVSVFIWDSLLSGFMERYNVKVLVRGVRGAVDFAHEFELALGYKILNPALETFFIPADPRFFAVRSSAVKEVASFNGDISTLVPDIVADALKIKYNQP